MSKTSSIEKDFNFMSLIQFAFPTMVMMIFMSLYTIVDGIFISRLIGSDALSSSNIVYPALNILIAAGVMLATGGSAIIAKKFGAGKPQEAREAFSLIVLVGILIGFAAMIIGNIFLEPITRMLGATDLLLDNSKIYLSTLLFMAPACILQLLFQMFFVTAGKPSLGLFLVISGGIANMILDYVFMGPLQMGIRGAALATGIGQIIPAFAGLIYFLKARKQELYFVKPKLDFSIITESCLNGSSEMVTNLSTAVVTYLFNIMMLKYLGEPGVAAITIVLYGQFLFNALYLGFSMGVAPVISFNHGSCNHRLLKRLFRICISFILVSSSIVALFALLASPLIVGIFVSEGTPTYAIAKTGFFIFSFNYFFAGINIFASALFTALSDGKVSAIISFVRTFVMIVINIMIMPYFFGANGIWLAVPVAECMTILVSLYYLYTRRTIYHYTGAISVKVPIAES